MALINPNETGGWHNVPQNVHLNFILLAIVHPDGNGTIFSRALLDADFGPLGQNQHPARLRERTLILIFGLRKLSLEWVKTHVVHC